MRGDASSWAALSPCGKYRYALGRSWQEPLFPRPGVLWVLHNPSTADAQKTDPTLSKCIAFAKREGYGELVLVNPMAWRATDKGELPHVADPIGLWNSDIVSLAARAYPKVIVGWGLVEKRLQWTIPRIKNVLYRASAEMLCLGMNRDGSPRHPLYLPNETALVPWEDPRVS